LLHRSAAAFPYHPIALEARMTTTWILVANSRHARLFANHGPNKGLELVQECAAEELLTNRPQGGRQAKRGEPPRLEARGFAHRLAGDLHRGRSRGRFGRAIIVAPPAFMGLINAELDGPTAQMVSERLDKDYTRSGHDALSHQLEQCLCV
jgi:protein required for attachment to host cells